jgi:excisionase family DNA binding protein
VGRLLEVDESIKQQPDRIEAQLAELLRQRTVKGFYTTDEAAALLGKAEFTVREWCRNGRINAQKRMSGRGAHPAWVIAHSELERYQREGLLPPADR